MLGIQSTENETKPLQDLCPVGEEEERFLVNSHPANPNFPHTTLIDWQYVLKKLHSDALMYLKDVAGAPNHYWAISHVVTGDEFDWKNGRTLTDLNFQVLALQKNEPIPWHHTTSAGKILWDSADSDWWPAFTQSLRNIDVEQDFAPMYGGEWESYFETVYRALVITALRSASEKLSLVRDTSVKLAPWPTTGASMSDMIAPNGKLHLLMNFDGETAEEVLSKAYGFYKFAPTVML
jgi:hypothetical protein